VFEYAHAAPGANQGSPMVLSTSRVVHARPGSLSIAASTSEVNRSAMPLVWLSSWRTVTPRAAYTSGR
jgi:hypothetical protein